MKTKILLFSLLLCTCYGTVWAQTSFGGFIDSDAANNAGTGGGITNSYFGYQAGLNTTGFSNTATGYRALYTNIGGFSNTANGSRALYSNTGNFNTATGNGALRFSTTGSYNTATGYLALYSNTTGYENTAVGSGALYSNTTGYENTAIGYLAGPNANNRTNTTALGHEATTTADNQVRIGNAGVNDIGGYSFWDDLSDGRFKNNIEEDTPGLAFIEKLRPVSYELDRQRLKTFLKGEETTEEESTAAKTNSGERHNGFIAQEVEQIVKENGYAFWGIKKPANARDHYGIKYAEFIMPLTKAVQELSTLVTTQQQLIETLQQELKTLKGVVYGNSEKAQHTHSKNIGPEASQSILEGFALHQNVPNPFHQTTTINAVVPENIQQAKIVVYNLQGSELASYDLNQRGNTSVEISGGRFASGMYTYALIADDRVIDTKKMILTK